MSPIPPIIADWQCDRLARDIGADPSAARVVMTLAATSPERIHPVFLEYANAREEIQSLRDQLEDLEGRNGELNAQVDLLESKVDALTDERDRLRGKVADLEDKARALNADQP